jgi:Ca2+-binding RTX toxin-like protein
LVAATAAQAAHVTITFDELAGGTVVTTQYPSVTFSSDSGSENVVTEQPSYNGSKPNFICTAPVGGGTLDCAQRTILDFTDPVNNLTFNGLGINDTGPVAAIDVYQGGVLTATHSVVGSASGLDPEKQDLSAYPGITRIVIRNITDGGGIGWDDFDFDTTPAPPPSGDLCFGQPATITGNGVVVGTEGDDVIITGNGNDTVDGKGGNDRICTRGGDDHARGGAGNDRLNSGNGNDNTGGQSGNDIVQSTGGNDDVQGGDGMDHVTGGEGNDTLNGGNDADAVEGEGGNDLVAGNAGAPDYCDGGTGTDSTPALGGCETIVGIP